MRIGIMDADLLCGSRHSFPNLACMKLSGFHKSRGDDTELVLDPGMVTAYDRIYVSKVFTDTVVWTTWSAAVQDFSMTKRNHCRKRQNTTCRIMGYTRSLSRTVSILGKQRHRTGFIQIILSVS